MSTPLTPEQVESLVTNQQTDPFLILGPHAHPQADSVVWIIRTLIPNSRQVEWLNRKTGESQPMSLIHPVGLYEITVADPLPDYQFRVERIWDEQELLEDPYRFPPNFLGDLDLHLFGEGNHHQIYEKLGSHPIHMAGVAGVHFAVWAPNARNVSLIGDFNRWDGRQHQMRRLGNSGIWALFLPGLTSGAIYKYEIKNWQGHIYEKSDPYGFQQEVRPRTGSIVTNLSTHQWQDQDWMEARAQGDPLRSPISVYEVHLGSWLHASSEAPPLDEQGEATGAVVPVSEQKPSARFLTYRELADKLIPYVKELGFTHIELLPVAEHPFDGSWGYQVIGHYAATSRYGSPQDLMTFIDRAHQEGIGVIVDWVPGHFPKDGHGLAFFDGSHLYEYADPRKGEHKDWGTLIFDYGRNEVRNYLVANALFWFDKYHIDGIRVDAVASTLYLDYSRQPGEWVTNQYGGREHIEAIEFFRQLNTLIFKNFPGTLSIAEESTSWPMVTWPVHVGGLGFNLKWNMGWMHDMLDYFHMDPWFRQFHQNLVTFSLMYAFSENYMLAFSHDEVVHGKSSMIYKMPGDEWGKFASVRCLFGYMFCHPGKKTLFMGMEFAQTREWDVWGDLEWHLLQFDPHRKLQKYVKALNHLLRSQPALYAQDINPEGFRWIDCSDHSGVISFLRWSQNHEEFVVVVCNFAPVIRSHYRIGVPLSGFYQELLNSDAVEFWGTGCGNYGGKWSDDWAYHAMPYSVELCLPPLSTLVLRLQQNS
ncbi:MAG: 1,4-alpha-glucan branching protein GlgB [Cyanobacteriota bacterium]|nr:1,4-alpha-glucan branching protein GlgB [Cyanobacteriota bacterium]